MDPSSTTTNNLSGWNSVCYQNPKVFDEIKSGGWCFDFHSTNLMQNCDLPPPVKIFTRGDNTLLHNSIKPNQHISEVNIHEENVATLDESDKLQLMKALQLSQSRARTAEKKASLMAEEKDRLSTLLLRESLRLFAHRQWMKLLQLEVSQLQSQKTEMQAWCNGCSKKLERGSPEAEDSENVASLTWCMTLALCLSFAGVGMAVGTRYFF